MPPMVHAEEPFPEELADGLVGLVGVPGRPAVVWEVILDGRLRQLLAKNINLVEE